MSDPVDDRAGAGGAGAGAGSGGAGAGGAGAGAAGVAVSAATRSGPAATVGAAVVGVLRTVRLVRFRVIVGGLVVLGVLQGVVWSRVAPGQQNKVFTDGSYVTLPTADYHPFTDMAIFVLAGLAVGLVAAVATWRVRAIRGAATLVILFLGACAGAAVAYGVGLALVTGVDPATVGATGHESIVVAAPTLASLLVLVAEPLAAVAVYTFLVAWDGRPDLGRRGSARLGIPE